ncbi:hypothetical protein BP5796_00471 [Coleophoma crateriformis]|uniref:Uncharacterized protein n=1 Tax=Coleophoma crateriformis TaxID=565419 RepID=A0A3D8T9L5_9HELO|nr:hypothetical protein BP5796_00471 [Coleophoma crateriformis]
MASEPTSPVRVPKAASTYSASTQDPELRSQINTMLLKDGHVSRIQDSMLHALNASPTNWPTIIQNHALDLLRSGDCTTFPQLMSRVLEDVRRDTQKERKETTDGEKAQTNGSSTGNGTFEKASLALPKPVVEEGVRITRECLEMVCEVGE